MGVRRTYVRPMDGWWRRDSFFLWYMARELTAPFVALYSVILLVTVMRLAQGRESFDAWVANLRGEGFIFLHVVLFLVFLYHTWTWFAIMPKTMPPIVVGGRRLAPGEITGAGIAASVVVSIALLAFFWGISR
jgi:succinate dehydrogenase subunit C